MYEQFQQNLCSYIITLQAYELNNISGLERHISTIESCTDSNLFSTFNILENVNHFLEGVAPSYIIWCIKSPKAWEICAELIALF